MIFFKLVKEATQKISAQIKQLSALVVKELKIAVGPTVTLWRLIPDFGVNLFIFKVDKQYVSFWFWAWTICHWD
jgi:hypothetical protein